MPEEIRLQRRREAINRICWGVALFNIVVFGLPLIEFAIR